MAYRNRMLLAATALSLAAGLVSTVHAQSVQKKVYCWNENGRKICSDALPVAAANAARTEIAPRVVWPPARSRVR